MYSKTARLFARKHSVMRLIKETQDDYRWWRYQDSEPECGYVVNTTTYSVPAYPFQEKPKTRRDIRTWLSRRQLRKRLYGAGYRNDELKTVFTEIIGLRTQNPGLASMGDNHLASQGLIYPFGWNMTSIRKTFGNRGRKVLTKGIRPFMVFLDEFSYYAAPGMGTCGLVQKTQSVPVTIA